MSSISLDDWQTENLVIRRSSSIPMNCIVGNDVFMKQSFLIDMQNKLFTTDFSKTERSNQLLVFGNQWFGFELVVGDEVVTSLFDTGAGASVVDPKLIENHPDSFEFVQDLEITDGSGKKVEIGNLQIEVLSY